MALTLLVIWRSIGNMKECSTFAYIKYISRDLAEVASLIMKIHEEECSKLLELDPRRA